MKKNSYKGLNKLVDTISTIQKINLPIMPHSATRLLHARIRNALLELAEELRLCDVSVFTTADFSHGNTILTSPICHIHVRPSPVWNGIKIIPNKKISEEADNKNYYEESFVQFLKNPLALVHSIQALVNIQFLKYINGRL